jgi:Holliday junction resolvase RusA-like endonuclease
MGANILPSGYRYHEYKFTVKGQPQPAPRLTQGSAQHSHIGRRYAAFKDCIRAAMIDAYPTDNFLTFNMMRTKHPFVFDKSSYGVVAIVSYALYMAKAKTGNCVHGDPDNICKAIFDALFADDRHVLPRCLSLECGVKEPRVDITVALM